MELGFEIWCRRNFSSHLGNLHFIKQMCACVCVLGKELLLDEKKKSDFINRRVRERDTWTVACIEESRGDLSKHHDV